MLSTYLRIYVCVKNVIVKRDKPQLVHKLYIQRHFEIEQQIMRKTQYY